MQNKENGLISVIVPIYNAEAFLEECVGSIQAQTYTDLEIILVNDGSSDRSGEVCDSIGQSDPRVKVIHKQNGGVASTRNAGLDIAKGKYIAFVDHDDTIDPDMYERMHAKITESGADICICGIRMIYSDYERIVRVPSERKLTPSESYEALLGDFYTNYACYQNIWNKLIRRDLFEFGEAHGVVPPIRFCESYSIGDDAVANANILAVAKGGIVYIDFTPYKWCRTRETLSDRSVNVFINEKERMLEHWRKKALSVLPHRACKIEEVIKCQICVGRVTAVHICHLGKQEPIVKLKWGDVRTILRFSNNREEKLSALLAYFFPAPIYRMAYKIYSKGTT